MAIIIDTEHIRQPCDPERARRVVFLRDVANLAARHYPQLRGRVALDAKGEPRLLIGELGGLRLEVEVQGGDVAVATRAVVEAWNAATYQAALSAEVDGLEEGSASALREQLRRAVYNYNRWVGEVWSSDLRGVDLDALARRQEVLERAIEKLRARLAEVVATTGRVA